MTEVIEDSASALHPPTDAPPAPAAQGAGPYDQKIQQTVQVLRELEAQEADLMQQLERTRVQTNRVRGRLDTLIELNQEAATGAPPPERRVARGRQR